MTKRSIVYAIAASIVVIFTFATGAGYAQTVAQNAFTITDPINGSGNGSGNKVVDAAVLSPEAMNEQLRAQQMEINELKDQVHKLEMILAAANKTAIANSGEAKVEMPAP